MRIAWSTISLIIFISISVFGLNLMPYNGSDHQKDCLASMINGAKSPCPQNDPLGFANFHNNAMKKMSSLILGEPAATNYLAVTLVSVLFGLILLSGSATVQPLRSFLFLREASLKSSKSYLQNIYWLSMHENSPSISWRH